MSKSLAQKKSAKKKRGEKSYRTSTRDSGYSKSRAPHNAFGPRDRTVASMLVRQPSLELQRIDVRDWHREGKDDVVSATAFFACGCSASRSCRITYAPGEREKMFEAVMFGPQELGPEETGEQQRKFTNLRNARWTLKQDLLGALQRQYQRGLAPHAEHGARE